MIVTQKKRTVSKKIKVFVFFIITIIIIFYISLSFVKTIFPKKYSTYVEYFSMENNIDKYLVYSVIKVESGFRETVVSNKGAVGLMQIMPDTGKWISEKMGMANYDENMLKSAETNIKLGCWYLDDLSKEFNGDLNLALAAYNGGRGNVKSWLSDPEYSEDGKSLFKIPFKETSNYLTKIKYTYKIYKFLYGDS